MQDDLIFEPYKDAIHSLERSLARPFDEYIRDSVIQRFEYTYELSWKMLKRYLRIVHGIDETVIRNMYRYGVKFGVMSDDEKWMQYHEKRNLTSHTYKEEVADDVYNTAKFFLKDAMFLCNEMEKNYARHKG